VGSSSTEQASPKRPATVTAASVIIMLEAGLGVCQLLGLYFLAKLSSSPDDVPYRLERDFAPFFVVVAVLVVLIVLALLVLEPEAWARIGVWVVSAVIVVGAVVIQLRTGWGVWPFVMAVVSVAVPNLLLMTPSANAYFRRSPRSRT
jgi:hypothetical protein